MGKYRVSIGFKGKRYYLGTYAEFQEAWTPAWQRKRYCMTALCMRIICGRKDQAQDSEWASSHPFYYNVERVNGEFQVQSSMSAEG